MSGTENQAATAGAYNLAVNPPRIRNEIWRWLMFSDYGIVAQRHMAIVWSCVLACILADVIGMQDSRLSFVSSNWAALGQCSAYCVFAAIFIAFASDRLRTDERRPAIVLRRVLLLTELLWRVLLPTLALLVAGGILTYVITSANLPLRDNVLADIDRLLGFDWPDFLQATNANPVVATLLTRAYNETGLAAQVVVLCFIFQRRGERLTEFMAILSLCAVAVCIGMWLVPAAGAFAYFSPAPQDFANFSAIAEMWPFGRTFVMLRDGSLTTMDLAKVDGIVSFPSFHTMAGLMTIYAARDMRWLLIPVVLVNGMMIVATLPVGGHHLADVLVGAALTIAAILLVRRSSVDRTAAATP
ncbi:phosphatase PAP2 family protein [Bradyrhizobium erythrophlei]|uniref:phosphatase PAP2 family protein n=1 Tax=Bradyrhizobium erythrophlei TaxID=1437360 RepID=UPI0035E7A41E